MSGGLEVEEQEAGGVPHWKAPHRVGDGGEDDGELVIQVVRGSGGHGADAVGAGRALHGTENITNAPGSMRVRLVRRVHPVR